MSEMRSSVGSFSALFKAANDRDAQKPSQLVRAGTFVGTPLYVAPEMLEFNSSSYYTDLWALGCILYEMLVGTSPFYAPSKDAVFSNVLECIFKFPPDIDKNARDLIEKLL
jgi:serine/threonine protein kinase